jgi:acetylornithine deacetylase
MVKDEQMQGESPVAKRLADLVGFDTRNPGGDERPLAEKLARDLDELEARHVEVIPAAGHFSTYACFGSAPPSLILNAHIDTVPADPGFTSDPFVLACRDGRLHALGSADTKGAIAAILEAITVRVRGERPPRDLAILFSGDEELTGASMRQFLASHRTCGLKRAIVCEPTGCRMGTRHRGVYAARISARGAGGHSSLADTIANPLAALARAAVALEKLAERSRPLGPPGLEGICMNLAALDGGIAFNVIPPAATLTFSIRPAPGVAVEPLLTEARASVQIAAQPFATDWGVIATNPAFATLDPCAFAPLLGELADHPVDLHFGTEAGQFLEKGIDAVVFGPGHIEEAHKADEFVSLDELEQAVRIFAQLIT